MTCILNAKALDRQIPVEEQIDSDIHWARRVHIGLVSHPNNDYPKVIEADYKMNNRVMVLDIRVSMVEYSVQKWPVVFSTDHFIDLKQHHLWVKNSQTHYGAESVTLDHRYATKRGDLK